MLERHGITMENTREIVLDTLLALEKENGFSHVMIRSVLDKYNYLENRDKAFIKRVCEGTIERRIELDYYLNAFSKVPVSKMKPLIRNLLRMSVYQLLYMDSIPDSAVCNEACKLAGKRKFQNLKGFINGILRNIAKNREELPLPDREKEAVSYLSVRYSMPEWIISLWQEEYGIRVTEDILKGLLEIHPVTIRFSGRLTEQEREEQLAFLKQKGMRAEQSPYLPGVYQVRNADGIADTSGFREGKFTVQDVSSILAVTAAGINSDDVVMDVCAAPGGKSVLAAETAEKVFSSDVSEGKAEKIMEYRERMRLDNLEVRVNDARVLDEAFRNMADVLIMDVPCSGLGVIGKKRDIKYHASLEGLKSITELQRDILRGSYSYVKPGGILLYSTCTIHRGENEEMVRWILDNLPFEPVEIAERVPKELLDELRGIPAQMPLKEDEAVAKCSAQLLPGRNRSDGFFFAVLRRKEER
ncbi:MAG: 16S rRNA (cytosine(967)-C(5))-methyltransferase RsmB [Acetatifactor sp.]|nr:16S rRNA (cytosine(967)-C(5))-methyltransferase RsmB [Acetatifactor sp.]